MNPVARQLPLDFAGGHAAPGVRRTEVRERTVRIVEYTPFPRVTRDSGRRVGFSRDVSSSGMCLGVEAELTAGDLLRVVVRGVDGLPTLDSLARVLWSRPRQDGGFWAGLGLVNEAKRRLLKVRHTSRAERVAVTA
ncbi:MAG: PilZ domain-containing protein [Proteobacteria bacterium]|nr:PilZ domain-containing protein [Pseudomonadota bacterium]